jgi:hypothetical protein
MIMDVSLVVSYIPEHKLRIVKVWKEYFEDYYYGFISDSTNY